MSLRPTNCAIRQRIKKIQAGVLPCSWPSAASLPMVLIVALLFGFGLRVLRLDYQSLWFDEATTAYWGRMSIGRISHELAFGPLAISDVPLYFYLAWAWQHLVGSSEYAIRYLSVIFGVVTLPLFYRFLSLGSSRRVALVGLWLLSIASFHVYYSQEARMHMLTCLLGLGAAYALLVAGRRNTPGRWAVYSVIAAANVYTFYYAALVIGALNVPFALNRRRRTKAWLIANLAVGLIWLPWLYLAYHRFLRLLPARLVGNSPMDPASFLFHSLMAGLYGVKGVAELRELPSAAAAPGLILLVAAVWSIGYLWKKRTDWALITASYASISVAGMYLVSLVVPVFTTRYLLGAFPGLVAALVSGLGALARRWLILTPLAIAALVVPGGLGLAAGYTDSALQRDNYRAALGQVREQSLPDEALIYDSPLQFNALSYYFRDQPRPSFGLPIAADPANRDLRLEGGWSAGDEAATAAKLAEIEQAYTGVWALYFGEDRPFVENWLDSHMLTVSNRWFGYGLRLKHYWRAPLPASQELKRGETLHLQFGPLLLRQIDVSPIEAGSPLIVHLLWAVTDQPSVDYVVSAQLFDDHNRRVTQLDRPPLWGGLPTSQWTAGRVYEDELSLRLLGPPQSPYYTLRVSVYDGQHHLAGQQQAVAVLRNRSGASPIPLKAQSSAGWTFQDLRLERALDSSELLTLEGNVQYAPTANYTWFVHLLDARGRLIRQDDHPPSPPTNSWKPGDHFSLGFELHGPIPSDGQLEIGAYDASGKRVMFWLEDSTESNRIRVVNRLG